MDRHLAAGVAKDDVEDWVPTGSVLPSNGDGLDIAVSRGRMVGVRGREHDRVEIPRHVADLGLRSMPLDELFEGERERAS
ncbi:hypothetical protein [Saccharopolyspora sp. NPDC049426]|uniref:hypothetical protein n=1 Tax=Saccharopolyspora sp. NPDC049426 TaxID=3155652 RepID=UPI003438864D